MANLHSKTAIITGASSGIGMAATRKLAHEGANVVIAARNREVMQTLADEISATGRKALIVPTDVREPDQCTNLIQQTVAEFGTVDILINNAGLGYSNLVGDLVDDEVRTMIETNLLGVMWCCNAVIPIMQQQKWGRIVNVGSVAGRIALPTSSVYCATKFGLDGFSQALRAEVRRQGIGVSLLNPGYVRTDFARRAARGKTFSTSRPGPWMTADHVADKIVELVYHPRRQVIVTKPYLLATGLTRFAPGLVNWVASFYKRK